MFKMSKRKPLVLVISCFMILSLLLTACGGGGKATPAKANGEKDEAKPKEIVVAENSITNILDSAKANFLVTSGITGHIFDRLVEFDERLNVIPNIAESWERVDELTWELTIADGFVFQNGEALKLSDIVYSMERIRNIPKAAGQMEYIESVTPIEGNKIRIKTTKPLHSLLRDLAASFDIVSESYVKEIGEEAHDKAPMGTGPYKLVEFIPGQKVVLERWEENPFEKPDIEKITYKAIEEASSRYIAIETGEADVVSKISHTDLERANNNNNINVIEKESLGVAFISLNTTKPPFDNKLVRRAIGHAVNREAFAELIGNAVAIDSMVSPTSDGYYSSAKVPKYDLEKAKELLKEAGYENGISFTLFAYQPLAQLELLQADLKSIGVDMKIENLEFGVFLERVLKGEYQIVNGQWSSDTGDSLKMLDCYITDSFGEDNISFYSNPKLDELYKKAEQALDNDELNRLIKEIQEIAAEDMPMIPTSSNTLLSCYRKDIDGIQVLPTGIVRYDKAVIKQD